MRSADAVAAAALLPGQGAAVAEARAAVAEARAAEAEARAAEAEGPEAEQAQAEQDAIDAEAALALLLLRQLVVGTVVQVAGLC